MMTKEEVIDYIVERYKEHKNNGVSWSISLYNCCQGIDCDNCPFDDANCEGDVVMSLLDRLVKAEERRETNLEHYWKGLSIGFLSHNNEAYESYRKQSMALFDWLFAPYEEPKPKYKLTKFEYDLLRCYDPSYVIIELWLLTVMQSKGYFIGIPTDVPIKDILDNCEVIDE